MEPEYSFSDTQYQTLVDNTILSKTEFEIEDYTGGSVQITSTNNNTITNYKVSLFFGYKNKKPLTRVLTIEKEMYYIWSKALMIKTLALEDVNLGMNLSDLNLLMNSKIKNDNSNKYSNKVKKSIVGVGLPVDLPQENELLGKILLEDGNEITEIDLTSLEVNTKLGLYRFQNIEHLLNMIEI